MCRSETLLDTWGVAAIGFFNNLHLLLSSRKIEVNNYYIYLHGAWTEITSVYNKIYSKVEIIARIEYSDIRNFCFWNDFLHFFSSLTRERYISCRIGILQEDTTMCYILRSRSSCVYIHMFWRIFCKCPV